MKDQIIKMLIEITGDEEIGRDLELNLFKNGLLYSMAIIEVILGIEDVFGIKLNPSELEKENIESVNKIYDFLSNYKEIQKINMEEGK